MIKDKEYWRLKKREQRAAAKAGKVKEAQVEEVLAPVAKDELEWDREKFPVHAAWIIALERANRARKYAEKFPEHVRPSEVVFQEVVWQYEHEGLPAVRKAAVFA